jgi:hypothetical protein
LLILLCSWENPGSHQQFPREPPGSFLRSQTFCSQSLSDVLGPEDLCSSPPSWDPDC